MSSIRFSRLRTSSQAFVLITSSFLLGGIPLIASPGVAQTRWNDGLVAQANVIQATSTQEKKLYLNNNRSYAYNLVVTNDTTINGLYIPAGAIIQGQYEPAPGGLRYVARAVELNGRLYGLDAVSPVLEDVKDPRDTSAGAIAGDAGIGAAGGAILGGILGNVDAGEVIGGAAAGVAVGNLTADRVVVIDPNRPIALYSR